MEYTDTESIRKVMGLLESSGFTNVQDTNVESRYYPYDIRAEYGGVKVGFEVKEKNCASDTYVFSFMRVEKYARLKAAEELDGLTMMYYVLLFNDGVMEIQRIDDYTKEGTLTFPHTTRFADSTEEEQAVLYYRHDPRKQFRTQ